MFDVRTPAADLPKGELASAGEDLLEGLLELKASAQPSIPNLEAVQGLPRPHLDIDVPFALRLQRAFETLGTLLADPSVYTLSQNADIIGDFFNEALERNEAGTTLLVQNLLKKIPTAYYDRHLQKIQENCLQDYSSKSPFRLKIEALRAEVEHRVERKQAFFPVYAAVLERKTQLHHLERVLLNSEFQGISNNAKSGYVTLYPDHKLVRAVEKILRTGKTYASEFLGFTLNSSGGFDDFLKDLRAVNEERKAGTLKAHLETPFASDQDNMVKTLLVLCAKLKQNSELYLTQIISAEYSIQLKMNDMLNPLYEKLEEIERLLANNANLSEASVTTEPSLYSATKGIREHIDAAWQEMSAQKLQYEQAQLDLVLFSKMKEDKVKLESANTELENSLILLQAANTRQQSALKEASARAQQLEKDRHDLAEAAKKLNATHQKLLRDHERLLRDHDRLLQDRSDELSSSEVSDGEEEMTSHSNSTSPEKASPGGEVTLLDADPSDAQRKLAGSKVVSVARRRRLFEDTESQDSSASASSTELDSPLVRALDTKTPAAGVTSSGLPKPGFSQVMAPTLAEPMNTPAISANSGRGKSQRFDFSQCKPLKQSFTPGSPQGRLLTPN